MTASARTRQVGLILVTVGAIATVILGVTDVMGMAGWGPRGPALTELSDLTPSTIESRARRDILDQPADASAWLELAWAASLDDGQLTQDANMAIARSYVLAPMGPEVTLWRLTFVFDHWASVSPEVRELALAEFKGVYPRRGWTLDGLAPTIQDPTGRMVAMMTARRLAKERRLGQRPSAMALRPL